MSAAKNLAGNENIALSAELVADIDKLAGEQGRSAFLTELVQREIKLRRQRDALREGTGAWNSEDHPELANGAEAWVRQIRAVDDRRFEDLERRREDK